MHRPAAAAALPAALLISAGLVLAGCSSDAPASTTEPVPSASVAVDPANAADVEFAQMMIVHHQGAIDMAALAADRAGSSEVKDLAARIEAAQQPEIDIMTGWLDAWGAEPLPDEGAMPGMDHGAMSDDGEADNADADQMAQLQDATGADFDRLFLELMIVHHQGAIDMARSEMDDGQSTDAVGLAQKVVADQTGEIDLMQKLLDQ